MKKETGLNYKVYGIRGGEPTYKENVGAVLIFTDGLTIDVDAFEGYGDTYKMRTEKLITIKNNGGAVLFEGNVQQFIEQLIK